MKSIVTRYSSVLTLLMAIYSVAAFGSDPTTPVFLQAVSLTPSLQQFSLERFIVIPHVGAESYRWKEIDLDGSTMLTESGPRFSIGVDSRLRFTRNLGWFADAGIQYSLGSVGYDGYVFNPQGGQQPYSSLTQYSDGRIRAGIGYLFILSDNFLFAPAGGLEYEFWNRTLDEGGSHGYKERYGSSLLTTKFRLMYLPKPALQVYCEGGIAFPFQISETVTLGTQNQGSLDVSLSPGINLRYSFEVGIRLNHLILSMSYESWLFSSSAQSMGYYQPKSSRSIFGFNAGYAYVLPW